MIGKGGVDNLSKVPVPSVHETPMDGGWTLNYDNVNRVSSAVATSGVWNNLTLSWTYDSFGNRKTQTPSGTNIMAPVPQAQTLNYPSQNRISNYGSGGYDGAGNVKNDLISSYLYDPEGRLCAVEYPTTGQGTAYMLYLYDGEGRRVAKVSNPTFSCTPATGYTLLETYLLGPSGEHITELGQAGTFLRSNVYANGQLLATYTNNKTYFALNDWLGSKRVVTNYDGTVAQMCMNLPFGDELICSANDLSEHHFTGQIHDQESGNDYFNARYYSNSTGRFLSPDPSGLAFADPTNPQSWNMYSYALNNPLTNTDPTGLDCVYFNATGDAAESIDQNSNSRECGANGGDWVNGATSASQISYNSGSDNFTIHSSAGGSNYTTVVEAPGTESDGTSCYGNCAQAYSSSTPYTGDPLSPFAQGVFGSVAQQTTPLRKGFNCAPEAALTGGASWVGVGLVPGIGDAASEIKEGMHNALTLWGAGDAGAGAAEIGWAVVRASKGVSPAVAKAAGKVATRTVEKVIPFAAAVQAGSAVMDAADAYTNCYSTTP